MAANYQQTYKMDVGMQQLQNAIRSKEFADQLRLELKSENPSPNGVWYRFHHGVTFSSWGEKITVTLTPLGNATTQVHIHSECGMPTQVIDWGKNKQVVHNIYEQLAATVKRFPSQPAAPSVAQPTHPSAPRFCSQCGKPVAEQAFFCGHCGNKLR